MADALNMHFQSTDPTGWHVFRKARKAQVHSTAVQRAMFKTMVHQQGRPPWISSTLLDCVRQGDLLLCKAIPRPLSLWGASRPATGGSLCSHGGKKPTSTVQQIRRHAAEDAQEQHNPSQMPETLWRQLGMGIQALAVEHLPGRSYR